MMLATPHGSRRLVLVRLVLVLCLLAIGLAGPASPGVRADTLVVMIIADTGDGSLRQAIAAAAPGSTITFAPSLSGATIYPGSPLVLDKDLTIDGSGLAEPLTLNGNDAVRVMEVLTDTMVTLNGLVIAHGMASDDNGHDDTEDDHGGGVYNLGTLTVVECIFSDHSADRFGGAIYSTGVLTVTRCTFSDNAATNAAGGIFSYGALAVIDSTFAGNESSEGGAINNQGALTVSGSTFVDNTALTGGAIAVSSSIPMTVSNSTFTGNTAEIGGGIVGDTDSTVALAHCTFFGNVAYIPEYGGGAILTLGVLTYTHTIIAGSVNGDCRLSGGGVASSTGNLVGDGSCLATWSGDPKLGPLADHGGPTQTMALLPGSPALNAGDPATCPTATDQRGVARPQGAACDLGAFEQETPAVTTDPAADVTPAGATLHGTVNARDTSATVFFEYGVTLGYGTTVGVPGVVTGTADVPVSAALTDLTPNTTYHYRVVAVNAAGAAYGADATFTTLAPPQHDLFLPSLRR